MSQLCYCHCHPYCYGSEAASRPCHGDTTSYSRCRRRIAVVVVVDVRRACTETTTMRIRAASNAARVVAENGADVRDASRRMTRTIQIRMMIHRPKRRRQADLW